MNIHANCPVCDAGIQLQNDVVESEVVSCNECKTRLVVENRNGENVTLSKAPEVEEDWGE